MTNSSFPTELAKLETSNLSTELSALQLEQAELDGRALRKQLGLEASLPPSCGPRQLKVGSQGGVLRGSLPSSACTSLTSLSHHHMVAQGLSCAPHRKGCFLPSPKITHQLRCAVYIYVYIYVFIYKVIIWSKFGLLRGYYLVQVGVIIWSKVIFGLFSVVSNDFCTLTYHFVFLGDQLLAFSKNGVFQKLGGFLFPCFNLIFEHSLFYVY